MPACIVTAGVHDPQYRVGQITWWRNCSKLESLLKAGIVVYLIRETYESY